MSDDRFRTAAALVALFACAGSAEAATLAGRLTYPGEALPPMTVVARDATGANVFIMRTARGQSSYRLAVRPGAYVVFAVPDAAPDPRLRGAYTAYSLCARSRARLAAGRCRTGQLVVVKVAEGDSRTGINVDDWHLSQGVAARLRLPAAKAAASAIATLPRYDAYPAAPPPTTTLAKPDYDSAPPAARPFRSSLEAAVANGPFFAGTVAVARWGCGSGCERWALIDRATGTITMPGPPLQPLDDKLPCAREPLEFQPDSRLLLVHRLDNDRVVTHALLWSDETHGLRELAQSAAPAAEFCARRP
jgi:hypothetical protein